MLDDRGQPVTDPATALDIIYRSKKGGLTPLGGTAEMSSHKGYGLALMVHILGGTLPGASFSPIRVRTQKPSDPDRLGHFFLAIDPAAPVLVPDDPEASSTRGGCGKGYRCLRRYTSGLRQALASHGCIARGRPGGR